jgi:hypothetical protein
MPEVNAAGQRTLGQEGFINICFPGYACIP